MPDAAFFPFDRATLLDNDLLQLCDRWPAVPGRARLRARAAADVPVLLLEGEDDLRTPVEGARRVAAQFPQAKLVVAPATGHSALGSDAVGLRRAGVRALLPQPAGVDRCPRRRREFPASPPPPTALGQVPPDGRRARACAGGR